MFLILIYSPVMSIELIFLKKDLIDLYEIKMFEIYTKYIYDNILHSKPYFNAI